MHNENWGNYRRAENSNDYFKQYTTPDSFPVLTASIYGDHRRIGISCYCEEDKQQKNECHASWLVNYFKANPNKIENGSPTTLGSKKKEEESQPKMELNTTSTTQSKSSTTSNTKTTSNTTLTEELPSKKKKTNNQSDQPIANVQRISSISSIASQQSKFQNTGDFVLR